MFPSKRITALEGQVRDLTATNATLTSERDTLTQQLAGVITAEAHAEVVNARDAALAEAGTLRARVTELETAAQSAGRQAADIVAGLAVPPVAAEPAGGNTAKTVAELRAEFDAERNPKARAAIWEKLNAAMK